MKPLNILLKTLMLERGISAIDICRRTGIKRSTMYNITSGRVEDMDFDTLRLLEQGLGVTLVAIKGAHGIHWSHTIAEGGDVAVDDLDSPLENESDLPRGLKALRDDAVLRAEYSITDKEIEMLRTWKRPKLKAPATKEMYLGVLLALRAKPSKN